MKTSTMTMIGVGASAVVILGWFMGRNKLRQACDEISALAVQTSVPNADHIGTMCSSEIDTVPFVTVVKIGIISLYREPTVADFT